MSTTPTSLISSVRVVSRFMLAVPSPLVKVMVAALAPPLLTHGLVVCR
jgi:hypothetical protein